MQSACDGSAPHDSTAARPPQNLDMQSQLVLVRNSTSVARAFTPISPVTLVVLRCLMLRARSFGHV